MTLTRPFALLDAKPRRDDEAQLQAAVVQHLKLLAPPNVIYYAIPNGEHRSKRTGGRLKAQGVIAGAPDMAFVLADGTAAYIEFKAAGGRLSAPQKAFQARCDKIGIPYVVCWSIDSAIAVLKAWGCLK